MSSARCTPTPGRPKGSRRIQAELTLGRGITVGFHAVELPVAPRRPAGRHRPPQVPAWPATRSDRQRPGPAAPQRPRPAVGHRQHRTPTREGKLSCAVVLDACSRRVIGWSIATTPTAALVTGALGMAIESGKPAAGTLIHSDQGCNAPPGRSASGPRRLGWCPQWVASAPATTML